MATVPERDSGWFAILDGPVQLERPQVQDIFADDSFSLYVQGVEVEVYTP